MPSAIPPYPTSFRSTAHAAGVYGKARHALPEHLTAKSNTASPSTFSVQDDCCVWHWKDEQSPAEGWIVIDSPVPTAAGGGLFLHADATLAEVRDVARSMSAKLAVSSQPQVVGAKGGIRFPPGDQRAAAAVLERFIRDNANVISQFWGTGGDINTDHAVIDAHAKKYCAPGTSTALNALRVALGCVGSKPSDIPILLGETLDDAAGGWSLEEYSVGYVMAVTLKEMLTHTEPKLLGRARLVIQGFGCVGATFAKAVAQLGIGRVVAISSQYGFLVDERGIDCGVIDRARRAALRSRDRLQTGAFDRRSLEAGLTQHELRSDRYTARKAGSTDEEYLVAFLAVVRADVFVPCAQRYVLTLDAIRALAEHTFSQARPGARYILAGANNIFSPRATKDELLTELDNASTHMLPEWVSNSGTANLFMRACSGLALKGYAQSNLEASASDTKAFIKAAAAKAGFRKGTRAMWEACHDLAAARREAGGVNLLGVKRLSHLKLTTPKVERAIETLTRVYGAKSNHDGTIFQLPASDDPTVSVVRPPKDSSQADMGLSARFAVYNLARAREVLKADNITFHERTLPDGSPELVLTREQAGYPMSLCQAPRQEQPSSRNRVAAFTPAPNVLKSVANAAHRIDHYASIMPNTREMKAFHERMLGFTHIRTFTVNAGSAPEGQDDGLMHVMGLPYDDQRVNILTEGLNDNSVFSKLMARNGAYVHHIAMKVDDVDAVFAEVRAQGWNTTSESLSLDLATGLRQFFLKEEEVGCILELIGHGKEAAKKSGDDAAAEGGHADANPEADGDGGYGGQGEFRKGNIVALAQSLII